MDSVLATDGWLRGVRHLSSPNCNHRPDNITVDLLVIHNISLPPNQFGGNFVEALFCNVLDCDAHPYFEQLRDLRVSAHFFIHRSGEVTQFVSLDQRAWHAGVSQWCGRENCNDFSVGIELEGADTIAYTDEQYTALQKLAREVMQYFPSITMERIVGHSDIAPARKTDPGAAFDWSRFRSGLFSQ
ncbi:MAG: 1,6-anhydro-N-acetylmuramyl-L-alanine amidase AmpD [Pseudomonadales bacterium]